METECSSASFDLSITRWGDPMHFHAYNLKRFQGSDHLRLQLSKRYSTDTQGIADCLGLQSDPKAELEDIVKLLESKLNGDTILTLQTG